MKNIILSLGLLTSFCAFSQAVPSFIENYSYRYEALTTEEGEQFGTYKVIAKDNKTFQSLNKTFKKFKKPTSWVANGIVFTSRENAKYTMIRAWAWGYRSFRVYEN